MNNVIQYRIKNVYGIDRKYPANEQASIICQMIKQSTLSDDSLMFMGKLGYKIERVI